MQRFPVEKHRTAVGSDNLIYYTYECGLARTVRAEQTVNSAFWYRQVNTVKSSMPVVALYDTGGFDKIVHLRNYSNNIK